MTSRPDAAPGLANAVPAVLADATVLVVDDHPANVALLEKVLRGAGVGAVHALCDARKVVSRCLDLQPDLVLLDLHMPHMDGYEVLAALQAALPARTFLPVLVLTSDATPEARERALAVGAKDFLTKPFDRVETLQRVHNLLETRALYKTVQDHNLELVTELERRDQRDKRRAAEHARRRARIEQAMIDGALSMVFQPVVDLRSNELVGMEALARFDCEPRRPPNEWFDEASQVGLGAQLEIAAVDAALAQLDRLPESAFMSVNLSPATATQADLGALLAGARGSRVVVELTEHERVERYEPLLDALAELRQHGARIAVDDAGAGYAGLQQLLRLQPDIIKLDLDLTRGIHADTARRALAGALVTFATDIGATIVAEGIETRDDLQTLQDLGVPWGQGYHLGKPSALPAICP